MKQTFIEDLFNKTAKGVCCGCRGIGAPLLGDKETVIFKQTMYDEDGENIELGYCICNSCKQKVYINMSIEHLIDLMEE